MTGVVLGTGLTTRADASAEDLYVEAVLQAIGDSGVDAAEIDTLITANSRVTPYQNHAEALADSLRIGQRSTLTLQTGGANTLRALDLACTLVAANKARHVLVAAGDNMRSGMSTDAGVQSLAETGYRQFEEPFGVFAPALFALTATRYMHRFGRTSTDLAHVAVVMRRHAVMTDGARFRSEIEVDDVLSSALIAWPLHRLDCAPMADGAGAIVIGPLQSGGRRPLAGWAGYGEAHDEMLPYLDDVTERPALRSAAEGALCDAGVSVFDVDVLMIYDPFTIETLVCLEALGLCERGQAGSLVSSGFCSLGGTMPLNPHGGLLSFGHPGRPGAIIHVIEAVRQLTCADVPDVRQVADAEVALVTAEGAMLSTYAAAVLTKVG